jgi:hypothetical protein
MPPTAYVHSATVMAGSTPRTVPALGAVTMGAIMLRIAAVMDAATTAANTFPIARAPHVEPTAESCVPFERFGARP